MKQPAFQDKPADAHPKLDLSKGYAAVFATVFIWSLPSLFMYYLNRFYDPWAQNFYRYSVACIAIAPLVLYRMRGGGPRIDMSAIRLCRSRDALTSAFKASARHSIQCARSPHRSIVSRAISSRSPCSWSDMARKAQCSPAGFPRLNSRQRILPPRASKLAPEARSCFDLLLPQTQ